MLDVSMYVKCIYEQWTRAQAALICRAVRARGEADLMYALARYVGGGGGLQARQGHG